MFISMIFYLYYIKKLLQNCCRSNSFAFEAEQTKAPNVFFNNTAIYQEALYQCAWVDAGVKSFCRNCDL